MPLTISPVVPADALARREQPVIAVGGLMLRPWSDGDAPAVQAAFDVPDVQFWHRRRIDDVDEAGEWPRAWAQRWAEGSNASWAITLPPGSGNTAIGYVALRGIDLAEGGADVSYWVVPAARGRQAASRAAVAVAGGRWATWACSGWGWRTRPPTRARARRYPGGLLRGGDDASAADARRRSPRHAPALPPGYRPLTT